MSKFKVGDKVKIPTKKSRGDSYEDFYEFIKRGYDKDYLVINKIEENFGVIEYIGLQGPTSNCFLPEDLELYEEEAKFEVGDEVEVIKNSYGGHPVGKKFTVGKLRTTNSFRSQGNTPDTIGVEAASPDVQHWHPLSDLKLIKKHNMKEIIGYKAPYDLFAGEYKKDSIWVKSKAVNAKGDYRPDNGKDTYNAMPQEIVETWEPVYKQEEETITLAHKSTKIVIGKNKITSPNEGTFTIEEAEMLQKRYFSPVRGISVGTVRYIVSVPDYINIGCTQVTKGELDLIISTYKKLNN